MYKGQVMKGSLCPPNAETIMGGARGKMEALRGWGHRNKDKNIKKQYLTLLTVFGGSTEENGRRHGGVIYVHQQTFKIGESMRRIKTLVDLKTAKEMGNHLEFL